MQCFLFCLLAFRLKAFAARSFSKVVFPLLAFRLKAFAARSFSKVVFPLLAFRLKAFAARSFSKVVFPLLAFRLKAFAARSFLEVVFLFAEQTKILGGDNEIRTHDPLLARQVLSQLSYTPVFNEIADIAEPVLFYLH